MDAFEQVVGEILWREGYWVRTSVKVELTKEDSGRAALGQGRGSEGNSTDSGRVARGRAESSYP
jgi:hypothetical protein